MRLASLILPEDLALPRRVDWGPMVKPARETGSNHRQNPQAVPINVEPETVLLLRGEVRVLFLNWRGLLWKSGTNRPDVADSVFLTLSGDGIRYPFATGTLL